MPIGSTVVYNANDLILSTVSSSGNTFQETKIAAATSSIILFNSNGLISSQSLNSTLVGTASLALTASSVSSTGNAFIQGANRFGATAILGTNDNQDLRITTSGSARIIVEKNGKIGIGTSVINQDVTINSGLEIGSQQSTIGGGLLYFKYVGSTNNYVNVIGTRFNSSILTIGYGIVPASGSLDYLSSQNIFTSSRAVFEVGAGSFNFLRSPAIATASGAPVNMTSSMFIASTGNVGIGTTNPSDTLTINGDVSILNGGIFELRDSSNNVRGYISGSTDSGTGVAGLVISTSGGEDIVFREATDINMVIDGTNGNVGIGATAPSNRLTVIGAASIGSTTYNTTAPTNGLIVEGDVGIGTTNPGAKLHVVSSAQPLRLSFDSNNSGSTFSVSSTGNLTIDSVGSGQSFIGNFTSTIFGSTTNVASSINLKRNNVILGGMNTANNVFSLFGGSSAGNNHLVITSTGNVGIGTTNPVNKLDVVGNISASVITASLLGTSSWSTNTLTASGLITTNNYTINNLTASGTIIYKNAVLLDFSSSNMPTTISVVLQNATSSYNAAFFDYVIYSGSNSRAGTIATTWVGGNSTYNEVCTTDIGNTNVIDMSTRLIGGNIQLIASGSVTNWNIKASGRYI